jgi:hypothetical protein
MLLVELILLAGIVLAIAGTIKIMIDATVKGNKMVQ